MTPRTGSFANRVFGRLLDRGMRRLAASYIGANLLFILMVRLFLPQDEGKVLPWQDPKVFAIVLWIVVGSILTVLAFIVPRRWWQLRPRAVGARLAAKWAPDWYLPVLSGVCTCVIFPATALLTVKHGPIVALVITRGLGIASARVIDECLLWCRIGRIRLRPFEDWAAIIATLAVWVEIVWPSPAEKGVFDNLDAGVVPVIVYAMAYVGRIFLINYYKNRHSHDAVGLTRRRAPHAHAQDARHYIALEELTAAGLVIAIALGWHVVGGVGLGRALAGLVVPLQGAAQTDALMLRQAVGENFRFILCGVPFGCQAIFAAFILLYRDRTATFTILVHRVAGGVAGFSAAVLLAMLPLLQLPVARSPLPSWRDVVAVGLLALAAYWLLKSQREPPPTGETETGRFRFARFLLWVLALVYVAQSSYVWTRVLYSSPYSNNVNWPAAIGEIFIHCGTTALPVFAVVMLVWWAFFTDSARLDLRALFGGLETPGAQPNGGHPRQERHAGRNAEPHGEAGERGQGKGARARLRAPGDAGNLGNAVQRIGLLMLVMGAFVGLSTWMQEAVSRRSQMTIELTKEFENQNVVDGRRFLHRERVHNDLHPDSCAVCNALKAQFRGDALDPDTLPCDSAKLSRLDVAARRHEDSLRVEARNVRIIRAALQAAESAVHYRRTGALSELEFHALWAGVVKDELDALMPHLDGNAELQPKIARFLPTLAQQIGTQPWWSDTVEFRPDSNGVRDTAAVRRALEMRRRNHVEIPARRGM